MPRTAILRVSSRSARNVASSGGSVFVVSWFSFPAQKPTERRDPRGSTFPGSSILLPLMHFRHDQVASTQSLTVRCRLFARYAEIVGIPELTIELPRPSTAVSYTHLTLPTSDLV